MQIDVRRKKLLERIIESLPSPLREAYDHAPRKGSEAHEILRLFVAKYLWENGHKQISFEKTINCNDGQNVCADVYEEDLNLIVECERNPDRKVVSDRKQAVKDVYPTAKFVLATQDRMGWRALRLAGAADEVWVVDCEGRVYTPSEWAEERRKTLKTIFKAVELEGYMNIYREAEEEYQKFRVLVDEEEAYWRHMLTQAYVMTSQFRVEWLKDINIRGVWRKHAEAAKQRMNEAKNGIIGKVVELLDAILALSSPYRIRLEENGILGVEVDWDAWQWLGWKDYPSKTPHAAAQYRLLEENLQKELKIALKENKKQEFNGSSAGIKQKIERDRIIEELEKEIAKMDKIIPLLEQRLRTCLAATQNTIS